MAEPIPFPDSPRPLHARMSFLDLLYGTLFHPIKTFRQLSAPNNAPQGILVSAICCVALISIVNIVVDQILSKGSAMSLSYLIPIEIVVGLLKWLWMAGVLALIAYVFSGKAHYETFLKLSALALLPGLLLCPVVLISQSFQYGAWSTFGAIFLGLVFFLLRIWSSLLFVLALIETYSMSVGRAFLCLLIPIMLLISVFGGSLEVIADFIRLCVQAS